MSSLREKIMMRSPCKGCFEEDDYDPCESSEDITDKDLAVLLKEEAAKLQKEKDQALAAEDGKNTQQNETVETVRRPNTEEKPEETQELQELLESEDQVPKKRICKKIIKNPFFTNRLKFSNDLPLPPPDPPPQFLPLVQEVDSSGKVICRKPRRKCRKKKGLDEDDGKGKKDGGKDTGQGAEKDGKDGEDDACKGEEDGTCRDGDDTCICEDKDGEGSDYDSKRRGEDKDGRRRRCKKKTDKPLCRKLSNVSISLLPPRIPPLQRDLPPKSPKDIPEVERQILMACGKEEKKCKKRTDKCKTK